MRLHLTSRQLNWTGTSNLLYFGMFHQNTLDTIPVSRIMLLNNKSTKTSSLLCNSPTSLPNVSVLQCYKTEAYSATSLVQHHWYREPGPYGSAPTSIGVTSYCMIVHITATSQPRSQAPYENITCLCVHGYLLLGLPTVLCCTCQ